MNQEICRINIYLQVIQKTVLKITATRVSVGKRYHYPPPVLWDIITDTEKWPLWGPTVRRVQSPDRYIRKGSRGRVCTSFNIWLPFEIIEYEHACFWNWKVASIKATGHRLQDVDAEGCILWFDVPLVAAPYALICRMALGQIEKLLSESRVLKR